MSETTTKKRILETAEKLFAKKGFAATSLRAIIKEAGVNTAAVHYHYGSKEGLIEAILQRQATPVNTERLANLDALERSHPEGPLPLEAVADAFLRPAIERHIKAHKKGHFQPLLFARAILEPDKKLRETILSIFRDVFARFLTAFARALPHLSREEVGCRMHYMIGAMVFTFTVPMVQNDRGTKPDDAELMTQRMVEFVAGGMRSPVGETIPKDQ